MTIVMIVIMDILTSPSVSPLLSFTSISKSTVKVSPLLNRGKGNDKKKEKSGYDDNSNESSIYGADDGSRSLNLQNASMRALLVNLLFDPSFPVFVNHVQALVDSMHCMMMSPGTHGNSSNSSDGNSSSSGKEKEQYLTNCKK